MTPGCTLAKRCSHDRSARNHGAIEQVTGVIVILFDVLGILGDEAWSAFRDLRRVCKAHTRIVITYYNFLWESVLSFAERLGLKVPIEPQNCGVVHRPSIRIVNCP